MEVGGRGTGGGEGDETSGLRNGKEWKSRETHAGKDKESGGGGDEKNVAHWRKVVRKKDKDVRSLSGECGAEIWGWNDEGRLDAIKRRYAKWILGLDKVTPNYILREETGEEEIRTKAARRAVNYEEGARRSDEKLAREMERQRGEKKLNRWEERRGGLRRGETGNRRRLDGKS